MCSPYFDVEEAEKEQRKEQDRLDDFYEEYHEADTDEEKANVIKRFYKQGVNNEN